MAASAVRVATATARGIDLGACVLVLPDEARAIREFRDIIQPC